MIICLIGEPASGKTTLMKSIMLELGDMAFESKPFSYHYNDKFIVLGKYDTGVFQGTDKLSMAVQPKAIEFVKLHKDKIILLEGDRLGNLSFFVEIKKTHELHIFCIVADEKIKESRHIARGDKQSPKFKKSKRTKIANILKAENCLALENNDTEQAAFIQQTIFNKINGVLT